MKSNAYTLYDVKSLTYSNPFYAPTHGAAIRIVQDAAQDPNTSLGRHPADFILYCVGSFDDQSAMLWKLDPREHVVDVVSLVQSKPQPDLFNQEAK